MARMSLWAYGSRREGAASRALVPSAATGNRPSTLIQSPARRQPGQKRHPSECVLRLQRHTRVPHWPSKRAAAQHARRESIS